MTKMRAVCLQSFGGPEMLQVQKIERPVPAADEVLIRVRAASFQSTGFTDTARTLIRTCPAPGSGTGMASIFTVPSDTTAACMVAAAEACAPANTKTPADNSE